MQTTNGASDSARIHQLRAALRAAEEQTQLARSELHRLQGLERQAREAFWNFLDHGEEAVPIFDAADAAEANGNGAHAELKPLPPWAKPGQRVQYTNSSNSDGVPPTGTVGDAKETHKQWMPGYVPVEWDDKPGEVLYERREDLQPFVEVQAQPATS